MAHQGTPEDEAVLQMLAGASFGPGSSVILPSGKRISGEEAHALAAVYAPADPSRSPVTEDPRIHDTVVYRDDDAEMRGEVLAVRRHGDRRTKVQWADRSSVPTWELTSNLRVVHPDARA